MLSGKWQPFCLGLNVLTEDIHDEICFFFSPFPVHGSMRTSPGHSRGSHNHMPDPLPDAITVVPQSLPQTNRNLDTSINAEWVKYLTWQITKTHWGWDKMAAISQTRFANGFSQMKILKLGLTFHWILYLGSSWQAIIWSNVGLIHCCILSSL